MPRKAYELPKRRGSEVDILSRLRYDVTRLDYDRAFILLAHHQMWFMPETRRRTLK